MGSIVYVDQRSKKSRKQLAKRNALAKETQSIRRELKRNIAKKTLVVADSLYKREGTKTIPSVDSGFSSTPLKVIPKYTGDKLIGIAVMHKSCLQPIFSKEQAEDSAHMRR